MTSVYKVSPSFEARSDSTILPSQSVSDAVTLICIELQGKKPVHCFFVVTPEISTSMQLSEPNECSFHVRVSIITH